MLRSLRTASILFVLLTVLTGIVYPLLITGLAQGLFPQQASGSLIAASSGTIGSEIIGQPFDDPRYFWGRPSATGPSPYNAMAGSGSNQAPTNPALVTAVGDRIAALRAADPTNAAAVPIDLVTASASGLDPHISPAAAFYQASRVAKARGLDEAAVRNLVEQQIIGPTWGLFGAARVSVLRLNLALDTMKP
jgi:K+-transporting ATPase ATPase C chain